MSSLLFFTDESQVFVATDTLVTSQDGKPSAFTTKAFIVPHIKLIIAGVGIQGFLGRWFVHINDKLVVRGIENLDYHTARSLASLWRRYKQELSIPDALTTTIYHFGFSETTGLIDSYAYRSANDVRSEPLEGYGLRLKPECTVPEAYSFPGDLRKMMGEQRAIQAAKPKDERLYIGGEIQVHHLMKSGFQVYTVDRFEDYASDETAIYDNFERQR